MNEGDSMDNFLTRIKDLKEQLVSIDEIIPNKNYKKGKCNYCRKPSHYIKECPKLKEKEAKKKEVGMAVVDASPSHAESANLV